MHPILVQELARQHMAALDREVANRQRVAIARSADRTASILEQPGHFGPLGLAAARLRLAVRGSAG